MPADPRRVIADLRELDERTGGPDGARRVCWTGEWLAARAFLHERLTELDDVTAGWTTPATSGRAWTGAGRRPWQSAPISTPSRTAAGSTARSA